MEYRADTETLKIIDAGKPILNHLIQKDCFCQYMSETLDDMQMLGQGSFGSVYELPKVFGKQYIVKHQRLSLRQYNLPEKKVFRDIVQELEDKHGVPKDIIYQIQVTKWKPDDLVSFYHFFPTCQNTLRYRSNINCKQKKIQISQSL